MNIGLNIVGRRPDGYHDIETVFYPIPLLDALEVKESDALSFRMAGTPLDCNAGDNLVIRAMQLLQKDYEIPPLDIYLYRTGWRIQRCRLHDEADKRALPARPL